MNPVECLRVEPKLGKYPAELFGHPYSSFKEDSGARADMENQRCPFMDDECMKFRKSEPDVKIGTCSLGMKNNNTFVPSVVCPRRIEVPSIFRAVKQIVFGDAPTSLIREVNMGIGSFDYVLVLCDGSTIQDFCCVEIQANGTTGTPWAAVKDMKERGRYLSNAYSYGFNLANQYQKTMMQQIYKKGRVTEKWKKHLIVVLQDVGLEYLQRSRTSDMSGLLENPHMNLVDSERWIHFATFQMKWGDDRWIPSITRLYDTTVVDVANMLGARWDGDAGLSDFIKRLQAKLDSATTVQ